LLSANRERSFDFAWVHVLQNLSRRKNLNIEYQVAAFESVVSVADWEWYESRVEHNTEKILALLDDASVHATFFVLGWVAERYLQLVRRIAMAQHEVACHGYAHRRIYTMTPQAFRQDIRQAKQLIEDAAAAPVIGYRAPSYSITTQSLWALTILAEEGFKYDSSIFPIRHDLYGIPHHPRFFHLVGSPQSRQRSRGSAIAATGRHGDGHWRAACPALATRDSLHRCADKNAWRHPPHAGVGWLGASERALQAAERYLWSLAHTTHRGACASGLHRAWVQGNAGAEA